MPTQSLRKHGPTGLIRIHKWEQTILGWHWALSQMLKICDSFVDVRANLQKFGSLRISQNTCSKFCDRAECCPWLVAEEIPLQCRSWYLQQWITFWAYPSSSEPSSTWFSPSPSTWPSSPSASGPRRRRTIRLPETESHQIDDLQGAASPCDCGWNDTWLFLLSNSEWVDVIFK